MMNYTLHCVHKGVEHYLQTGQELADVKVNRGKVINWLAHMGVELDNTQVALLVIREGGVAILQAAYGPPKHAWRKFEPPEEPPKPQVHPLRPISDTRRMSPYKGPRILPWSNRLFASLEARILSRLQEPLPVEGPTTGRIPRKPAGW